MALTVVLVALVTVASRVAAVVVLPEPRGALAVVLTRLPAPLFGALAAHSLMDAASTSMRDAVPVFVAAACATAAGPSKSLLVVLAAGGAGFVLGALALGAFT